jgi:hypothetical protein
VCAVRCALCAVSCALCAVHCALCTVHCTAPRRQALSATLSPTLGGRRPSTASVSVRPDRLVVLSWKRMSPDEVQRYKASQRRSSSTAQAAIRRANLQSSMNPGEVARKLSAMMSGIDLEGLGPRRLSAQTQNSSRTDTNKMMSRKLSTQGGSRSDLEGPGVAPRSRSANPPESPSRRGDDGETAAQAAESQKGRRR